MQFRYGSSFKTARSINSKDSFLSLDEVRNIAPAIFADSPHESRSARYGFVPTAEIISGLIDEGFHPISVTQATSRKENGENAAKHLIRLRHETAKQENGLYPEVVLLNSHDGSTTYRLMAGLFRMVCSNGLIAGDVFGDCRVPHKAGALDRVIEGSYSIIKESPRLIDAANSMEAITLEREEVTAFNRAALVMRYGTEDPEQIPIQPVALEEPRRRDDQGRDLWRTFNRTQEHLMRGGLHGQRIDEQGHRRRTSTREIKGVDQTLNINRGLWMLAEEMRRIKTGGEALRMAA